MCIRDRDDSMPRRTRRQCGVFRHCGRHHGLRTRHCGLWSPCRRGGRAWRSCVGPRTPRPARRLERRRFLQRRGGPVGPRILYAAARRAAVGRQGFYGIRNRWWRRIRLWQRLSGPARDRARADAVVLDAAADSRAEDARVEVRGGVRLLTVDCRRRPSGGWPRGERPRPTWDW